MFISYLYANFYTFEYLIGANLQWAKTPDAPGAVMSGIAGCSTNGGVFKFSNELITSFAITPMPIPTAGII